MDPQLDWQSEHVGGVVLLAVAVDNPAAVPCRVRVESRLDGPVLPPRSAGVPEPGWDRDGYEGVVPADGRIALGFACPSSSARSDPLPTPPVELTAADPARPGAGPETGAGASGVGAAADGAGAGDATAATVVREFGRGTPPRDAVPGPPEERATGPDEPTTPIGAEPSRPAAGEDEADGAPGRSADGHPDDDPTPDPASELPAASASAAHDAGGRPAESPPEPVEAWIDAVEARVELAESLTDPDLPAATRALRDAGGLDPAASAVDGIERDAATLRRVAERAETLAERAEATDVPLDALRRLA